MDNLDPRSIRKGSKIRLDDTTEGSDGFLGGTVGHVDPEGRVIIDHVGTFYVEGLTKMAKGYTVFRLAEHTPPKLDLLADVVHTASRLDEGTISALGSEKVAAAIREKFVVLDRSEAHRRTVVDAMAELLPGAGTETLSRVADRVCERLLSEAS